METIVASFILGLLAVSAAHADTHGSDARIFVKQLRNFAQTCNQEICQAPNEVKLVFSAEQGIEQTDPTISSLAKIAWEQAQVWADTILEGDYQAEGNTRLDAVYVLYRNQELLGYRITYSEKAWSTSECSYDGSKKSLENCPEGRIVESSFVSPTLKTFVADENQFAVFLPN